MRVRPALKRCIVSLVNEVVDDERAVEYRIKHFGEGFERGRSGKWSCRVARLNMARDEDDPRAQNV